MIAAFLKNADGNFDYPAALFCLFLTLATAGLIRELCRSLRRGSILVSYGLAYGGSGQFLVDRNKNPVRFWFMYVLYCFGVLLFVSLIVALCFGLLRKL
jgi:hypothetical protein